MTCIPWDNLGFCCSRKRWSNSLLLRRCPPTKNPPRRMRKSGWGAANAKHSHSREATSLPPTPTAFSAKQSLMLSHTRLPGLSSLGHLASPGFKPVIYKRCKAPRESLASGLLLSPSLEILVSPGDSRIMPGQVELDKAGSSLLGATCRDTHLWASLLQPPIPIRCFRLLVATPVARGQEVPRDRGVGVKALVKWPFGKPWPPSD